MREVFNSLMPYRRWCKAYPNLSVGDICLLMTDSKVSHPTYRLCRIAEVFPDINGLVRTVRILSRPRDTRESSLPYQVKELTSQTVSVQRLVLVMPSQIRVSQWSSSMLWRHPFLTCGH